MFVVGSMANLAARIGEEVAVSPWICVTQDQIDKFAEATGDRQWIHLDAERARRESPFGATVAHGFLTLSLIPAFMHGAIELPDAKMNVNYGLNRVRFVAPVPEGSSLRSRIVLLDLKDLEPPAHDPALRVTELVWRHTIERQGNDKPVCVADAIIRRYW